MAQPDRPLQLLRPQGVPDVAQQAVRGLGIATVYRQLQVLMEKGELGSVNLSGLALQGSTVEDDDLTLYGRCENCAPPATKSARRPAASRRPAQNHRHRHRHRHRD